MNPAQPRGPMPPGAGPAAGTTPPAGVPTRRSTRVNLMLGILVAVVAVVLIFLMGGSGSGKQWVYRATQKVPARAQLSEKMFVATQVQKDDLVQGAFTAKSKKDLAKKVRFSKPLYAQYPMSKGSQLTKDSVTGLSGSDVDVAPDESLISVTASPGDSVAGSLKAGDTVDVYAIAKQGASADSSVSNLVLANAKIVTVAPSSDLIQSAAQRQASGSDSKDTATRDELLPSDPIPGIYVLKVKAISVSRFALLDKETTLYLAYRGPGAQTALPTKPVDLSQAVCAAPDVMTSEGQQPGPAPVDPSTIVACP